MSGTEQQEVHIPTLEDMFSADTTNVTEDVIEDPLEAIFKEEEPKIEKEAEVEKPVTTEEIKEEPKPKAPAKQNSNLYTDLIKDFIEEGDWEDGQIEIDGQPFILSELENVDKATFNKLKAGQKALKEEKNKDKYISTEGIDDTGKKLIELIKTGGDVSSILQYNSEVIHPLKDLDLSDLNVQRNVVYHKYKAQGLKDTVIRNIIKDLEAEFRLDEETAEAVEQINGSYNKMVEDKLEAKQQEEKARQESIAAFSKNLSTTYKGFELKDTIAKNLIASATNVDKSGWTKTDTLYFKAKEDPEFYSKINYMLNDPKAFEEFVGSKIKNKTAIDTMIKISSIEKKASSSAAEKPENNGNWEDFYQK